MNRPGPISEQSRRPSWWRTVVHSRLLHFVVLGGLIFAIAPRVEPPETIVVDQAALDAMGKAEARRLGQAVLSDEQRRELKQRAVSDEVLYREALRLGLDRDDPVVRQRLIQKVLFLAQDLAGSSAPATEDELRSFFESTRDQWARPPRVRFLHVYGIPAHRDQLAALADEAASMESARPGTPPSLGDAFPVSRSVDATRDVVAADFGDAFADAVFGEPAGAWQGPFESKHGWHLVKVLERDEGGAAGFDDVRGKLPLHYLVARRKEVTRDFVLRAALRYRVEVRDVPPALQTARALPRTVDPD